jgi:hypothetical protein
VQPGHEFPDLFDRKGLTEDGELTGESLVDCKDVKQGALGDCYLMGALSVLAMSPAALLKIFPDVNGHHQRYNVEGCCKCDYKALYINHNVYTEYNC